MKRAVSILIQNCISHNAGGSCCLYITDEGTFDSACREAINRINLGGYITAEM